MSCEEQLNALRRAEQELAAYQRQHPDGGTAEHLRHVIELTAALREKQAAYIDCRGRLESVAAVESLMRDETGKPLGGGAGPPM